MLKCNTQSMLLWMLLTAQCSLLHRVYYPAKHHLYAATYSLRISELLIEDRGIHMQHNRYAVCEGQVIQVIFLSYTYRFMTFTFDCTLTSTERNRQILTVNPEVIKVSVNLINITTLISHCKHQKNAKTVNIHYW